MKILLQQTDYKEVEIENPFYAHIAYYDEEEIFVRIDEKEFKQITFHTHGKIEFFTCATHNLASIWYDNKSDEKTWLEAVERAKQFVNQFL